MKKLVILAALCAAFPAYADGDKLAMDLDYVPLPDSVVKMIQASWKNQIKDASGKSVW